MAGGSSSSPLDINIDAKRSSTAVVREALFRATGEEKWKDSDEWAYFLVREALRFILDKSHMEVLETTVLYL